MSLSWKTRELIALLRRRYPAWDGFAHPPFVQDEIAYKRATIARASQLLDERELRELLSLGEYDEFTGRLGKIGKHNNLLWRRVPSAGDLAILSHPHLDQPSFCERMLHLLYDPVPAADRLQAFTDYAAVHALPNKWPFVTYFLFVCHPNTELYVRPHTIHWFLQFMGQAAVYTPIPTAAAYRTIQQLSHDLLAELREYGATDLVDVQSLLWVAYRASQETTGGLTLKDRVELEYNATNPLNPSYALAECAAETGFDETTLAGWRQAIERKGQAILYGPPGTGKTYLAEKLAQHLVAEGDGFIETVQFHPAYSYEEFVQGIRPQRTENGLDYPLLPGRFLTFCRQARLRAGRSVLILDEINRANLAQVFGEVMSLLEYRERPLTLAGGGSFSIPANVVLLGTMNTADRSIALVDYALRRRFAFLAVYPDYGVLQRYHARHTGLSVDGLVRLLQQINGEIGDPHYALGITFFLRPALPDQLESIWRTEIEPYLEEYFFDRPARVNAFRWEAVKAVIGNG